MNTKNLTIGAVLVTILIGVATDITTGWVSLALKWLWTLVLETVIFQTFIIRLSALLILMFTGWWLFNNKDKLKSVSKEKSAPSTSEIVIPMAIIACFIVSGIILLMYNGSNSSINQSKNIGVVYNSDIVDETPFISEITTRFKQLTSKHGTSISIDFYDLRGKSNPGISLNDFTKEKNIRYLILNSISNELNIENILDKGSNKYLSVNTFPIDLTKNQKSELISMHISARQEVASFVKYLVSKNIDSIILVHPPSSTMDEFEKNFYQSLRNQTIPHFIEVREIADNQLSNINSVIDSTANNTIVMLGDENVYSRLDDQISKNADYDLLVSNYSINSTLMTLLSDEDLFISLPWPKSPTDYIPLNKHLIISAIESILELDIKTTNENGKKIQVRDLRQKMFDTYPSMELALTQEYFGKTDMLLKAYPHFIVYNLQTKGIRYD